MSTKDMEKFAALIKSDAAVQKKIQSVKTPEEFVKVCSSLAKEKGYVITAEEFQARINQNSKTGKLSEVDLAEIAGGSLVCQSGATGCSGWCNMTGGSCS